MSVIVSLVIAVHNGEDYLSDAIESVLAQTYHQFELILWDNGSTDDSLEIIHHYANQDSRIRFFSAPHQRREFALAAAIAQTTGLSIGLVDSDDLLAETALEETVQVLESQPNCNLVYTDYTIINQSNQTVHHGTQSRCFSFNEVPAIDYVMSRFWLWRRNLDQSCGQLQSQCPDADTPNLWFHLSNLKGLYHLSKPLYYYRYHRASASYPYQIEQILQAKEAIASTLPSQQLAGDLELSIEINGERLLLQKSSYPTPSKDLSSSSESVTSTASCPQSTTPLVSIVIPCYNAAPRLNACLQSCLAQTYANVEIIFVDNNSTDQSVAIAQNLAAQSPYPIRIVHCPQKGANYARNYGFTYAQGDYIQWLDADDELAPDKIALQVAALEQNPSASIACADWEWHYYQQKELQFCLHFSALCAVDPLLQGLLHHWHPPHAYLLRRSVVEQLHELHAWYPGAPIGNDREYFTTAAIVGCHFLPVPGAKVRYYTWSNSQLTFSTSYTVRVESMQQIFERFSQRIQCRPFGSILGLHWFLLRQNWDVWEMRPIQVKSLGGSCFWAESLEDGLGLTVTLGEARIATVFSQLQGTLTLDDYSYQILRVLWRQVVALLGVTATTVDVELAHWIGLLPSDNSLETVATHSPTLEQSAMLSAIDLIPLYAPMFPAVRFTILQTLDRFRVAGLLRHPT
jgi:glycosyltransferase involved in cell wall biosynthesis